MEQILWSQRWSLAKSYFPGNLLKKSIISSIFIELEFLHVLMFRPAPGDSNATEISYPLALTTCKSNIYMNLLKAVLSSIKRAHYFMSL